MGNFIKIENFPQMLPYIQMFKDGLAVTVLLALLTVVIGFVLALVLAGLRMSSFRPFRPRAGIKELKKAMALHLPDGFRLEDILFNNFARFYHYRDL